MTDSSSAARTSSIIGVVTLLGAALLRVLGILLDVPALSWLALVFVLAGVTILVVRLARHLRSSRS